VLRWDEAREESRSIMHNSIKSLSTVSSPTRSSPQRRDAVIVSVLPLYNRFGLAYAFNGLDLLLNRHFKMSQTRDINFLDLYDIVVLSIVD
jgi:hypothetical protein